MKLYYILLFSFFNTYSQDFLTYYSVINDAEINYINENYSKSDSLYKVAFNSVEKPFKEDFLSAAINANSLENIEKCVEYLLLGVNNGLTLKRIKKNKKRLKCFFKHKDYNSFIIDYQQLRMDYLSTINISLRREISEMSKRDQKARKPIFGSSSQMKVIDSLNYTRLVEIIKKNNNKWPGFSTIGEISPNGKYDFDLVETISVMPLHFKKEQVRFLEPYMREAVLSGNMYPYQYARIIDYRLENKLISTKSNKRVIKKEFCTLYGTFTKEIICDCEKSEEERKKIGLEPLDDFYRKKETTYKCN